MKRLFLLLSCSGALVWGAELEGIHSIYLLPMQRGLDQYLANRVTRDRLFQVVTDPKLADAIFTDRIGVGFEKQLEDISPSPEPVAPAPKKEKEKDDSGSGTGTSFETVNKLENPALNSTFGRAKGTVFLVDAKSRQVLWSLYQPPKSSSSTDMDRTASDIVSRLKKDLKKK
jgi:hypothetical protein